MNVNEYTTKQDAYDAGLAAGKQAAEDAANQGKLTLDQVRKMTPDEIKARKPEVDAALREGR